MTVLVFSLFIAVEEKSHLFSFPVCLIPKQCVIRPLEDGIDVVLILHVILFCGMILVLSGRSSNLAVYRAINHIINKS